MLITCPECGNKASEAASACPKCGKPFLAAELPKLRSNARTTRAGCWIVFALAVGLIAWAGGLFKEPPTDGTSRPGRAATQARTLSPLAAEIQKGPCIFVLWRPDAEGIEPNMFNAPQSGNEFWVVRVAVLNHGYSTAPVNDFGFSLQADNGVEYTSNPISPLVKKQLPSVELSDRAWEWGYIGFEVPKAAKRASLGCAGLRRIVLAPDSAETRKALHEAGISVPADAMPTRVAPRVRSGGHHRKRKT